MDQATNVWAELEHFGDGVSGRRLKRIRSETLAAVWELSPGAKGNAYHFHHGAREWLLVLRGRLALRTHEGDRELSEGDVVAFPRAGGTARTA